MPIRFGLIVLSRHQNSNFSLILQVFIVEEVLIADVVIFHYVHICVWDAYLSKFSV